MQQELSVIQKMYDLIIWFVPIVNKFPRDYKFTLGNRIQNQMYEILETLVLAKYEKEKLNRLEIVNSKLDVLRYQTKLLLEFKLIDGKRFFHAAGLINEIGIELGSWVKQQKTKNNDR